MSDPIKYVESKETAAVNLFRFVDIAEPPAKMPSPRAKYNFLENPDPTSNTFMTAIDGLSTDEDLDDALGTAINNFTPYQNYQNIEDLNQDLFRLSDFVSSFSKEISLSDVQDKLSGITTLNNTDLNALWENLFYQTITTNSKYLANIITQVLRTNQFVEEFNQFVFDPEPDEEKTAEYKDILKRVATSNVIIPKKLVVRNAEATYTPKDGLDALSKNLLSKQNNADKARDKIRILKTVRDELENADKKYNQENSAAYKAALETHNENIESLPRDQDIPDFEFTPADPFSDEFLNNNLSTQAKAYFDHYKKSTDKSFDEIINTIDDVITNQYSRIFRNAKRRKGYTRYNNTLIPFESKPASNTYIVSSEKNIETGNYSLFLTHFYDNPEMALIELDITADDGSGGVFQENVIKPVNKTENFVTYKVFHDGLADAEYSLDLQFKIEDDNYSSDQNLPVFMFLRPGFGRNYDLVGPGNDTTPGNEEVKMHGVKHRGVMEYKRVEQEICCYVPGEVSHIENIMAREYKEKVSRTLNRSEITQEDSTEKEVENLHDTTSVDRYEMNKEVGQVIQEEQSRNIAINAGGECFFFLPGR